ncbi:hypothetical protein BKA65DRAFT_494876, partial [Rhexocercosporidium sp. MPI-PUGE-AT-0058]
MVRSLGAQSRVLERKEAELGKEGGEGGGGGRLMIDVTRSELNCSVHIEVQTRSKSITHRYRQLRGLDRRREEQVFVVVLRPVVKAGDVVDGDLEKESRGDGEDEGEREGVFAIWKRREMRFGGCGMGNSWKVCRGEDLGWCFRGRGARNENAVYRDDEEDGDEKYEEAGAGEELGNEMRGYLGRNWMKCRRKRGRAGWKSVSLGGETGLEIVWENEWRPL